MTTRRKLVVIGDSACGKTSLLRVFYTGLFDQMTVTILENRVVDMTVDNEAFELELWDTIGGDEYDRLRPLSYPNANLFLLCFAVDRPWMLGHVEQKYVPEVLHFCPQPPVPYLLVGCKSDLRAESHLPPHMRNSGDEFVAKEEAESVSRRIGAVMYLECSSKTGDGVKEVFQKAAFATLAKPPSRKRDEKCLVL